MSIYVLAQSSDTAAGGGLSSIFLLVLAAGVFFLITLPQRRMRKQQSQMQSTLDVGDNIRTIGGIRGTILEIDEDKATIQVEDGKLVVERRAISGKIDS
jgi:preprotein translocase subunit YajC